MIITHFDGDDIGTKLELMLLDNKESEAREYSRSVSAALNQLQEFVQREGADVILSGGDDLIASWKSTPPSASTLQKACDKFSEICGRTLSVGIGESLSDTTSNLRRAKLQGKNQIVSSNVNLD